MVGINHHGNRVVRQALPAIESSLYLIGYKQPVFLPTGKPIVEQLQAGSAYCSNTMRRTQMNVFEETLSCVVFDMASADIKWNLQFYCSEFQYKDKTSKLRCISSGFVYIVG